MRNAVFPETMALIVEHYRRDTPRREAETRWWRAEGLPLDVAIWRAARAELDSGVIHPHQRRLGRARLALCAATLGGITAELARAETFFDLHRAIHRAFTMLQGVGELAPYDATDRLAHHLGLAPTLVYLHTGSRIGARRLMGGRLPRHEAWSVFRRDMPEGLRALDERELEDVLCIYKDHLFDTPSELLLWLGENSGCAPGPRQPIC